MIQSKIFKFYGFLGLADIYHLKYIFSLEYESVFNHVIYQETEAFRNNFINLSNKKVYQKTATHYYKKAYRLRPKDISINIALMNFDIDCLEDIEDLPNILNKYNEKSKEIPLLIHHHRFFIAANLYLYNSNVYSISTICDNQSLAKQQDITLFDLYPSHSDYIHSFYFFDKKNHLTKIENKIENGFYVRVDAAYFVGKSLMMINNNRILAFTSHLIGNYSLTLFSSVVEIFKDKAILLNQHNLLEFNNNNKYTFILGDSDNFYHFIFEFLSTVITIEENSIEQEEIHIICEKLQEWQKRLINFFSIKNIKYIELEKNNRYIYKNVLIPNNTSKGLIPSKKSIELLRQRISIKSRTRSKKIFLGRKNKARSINNKIEAYFSSIFFDIIYPEDYTIEELIDLFSETTLIIGQGGAALSNIIFAPSGIKIIMIANPNNYYPTFDAIASALNQDFYFYFCKGIMIPNRHYLWSNYELEIDIQDFDLFLKTILKKIE